MAGHSFQTNEPVDQEETPMCWKLPVEGENFDALRNEAVDTELEEKLVHEGIQQALHIMPGNLNRRRIRIN